MASKKKFPDLTGDGKVTKKDILKGRGVAGFEKGGKVDAMKEHLEAVSKKSGEAKQGDIQAKYPSKGTRTRQGMPSKLTKKDKEELSKLRPPHRDPGKLEREMKLEQELLRRGDDKPVKTFRDGGVVRGCKGVQVSGKGFKGTY